MEQLLAAFFAFVTSLADTRSAEALLSTAKDTHLTAETAAQHVAAARFAAVLTGTDPDLLLAIAHHESRYEPNVVGPPVRGKHACGVMQQVPVTGPCPTVELPLDYLEGARHLAEWIRAQKGDVTRALVGYAGGYALLALYEEGGATRAQAVVRLELARAECIRRAREIRRSGV
ncbi:MAG TPA: lytic transglycosylase domain-containing protein [Gaiellaceae bacterium]|nr:lytic transglycosylase domain-containing protein [Gaiellaceae bacterium]